MSDWKRCLHKHFKFHSVCMHLTCIANKKQMFSPFVCSSFPGSSGLHLRLPVDMYDHHIDQPMQLYKIKRDQTIIYKPFTAAIDKISARLQCKTSCKTNKLYHYISRFNLLI